jgi:hypothetical protein
VPTIADIAEAERVEEITYAALVKLLKIIAGWAVRRQIRMARGPGQKVAARHGRPFAGLW